MQSMPNTAKIILSPLAYKKLLFYMMSFREPIEKMASSYYNVCTHAR